MERRSAVLLFRSWSEVQDDVPRISHQPRAEYWCGFGRNETIDHIDYIRGLSRPVILAKWKLHRTLNLTLLLLIFPLAAVYHLI